MTASRHQHHYRLAAPGQAGLGARLTQTLRSISWAQRKLFLLVFLWTCVCLVVFKTSLLTGAPGQGTPPPSPSGPQDGAHQHLHQHREGALKLAARSAASLRPTLTQAVSAAAAAAAASSQPTLEILAPEFDLPSASDSSAHVRSLHQYQYKTFERGSGDAESSLVPVAEPPASPSSQTNVISDAVSASPGPTPARQVSEEATSERRATASGRPSVSSSERPLASTRVAGDRAQAAAAAAAAPVPATTTSETQQMQAKRVPASKAAHRQPAATSRPPIGHQCHYSYPNLFDLQFNNIHWQKFVSQANGERYASSGNSSSSSGGGGGGGGAKKQATFYLYNAYYDDRWRGGAPSVRVLAMIDRIRPPPTNCLLWSSKLAGSRPSQHSARPLVTRAEFVYAWYPKWGNYEDGLLQPWIVTCRLPRDHLGLVPDSVSLVDVPAEHVAAAAAGGNEGAEGDTPTSSRKRRDSSAAELMPPSFSSSSSAYILGAGGAASTRPAPHRPRAPAPLTYDCKSLGVISNNLPVFNRRPAGGKREKFAVCVKGLDFPQDGPESRTSIRLVEWIEMLNLLGAKKIFLYNLDVHENISRVLNYYQQRGLVELSPLTLPGDQPNLPEYQHLYLKQRLTSKRQNELIPYNDCLYRNLYSYEYLALLDIDELIMPLKAAHGTWHDLMGEVERLSLSEQNYSRASYNVRNVYFFDDLSGPLGTTQANTQANTRPLDDENANASASANETPDDGGGDDDHANDDESAPAAPSSDHHAANDGARRPHRDSAERGIPHYLHMMSHVYRSKNYTEPGQYVKCFHNTERVVSLHNHFPMNCFGQCTTYSIPLDLAHLQHYRKDCVGPLRQSCKNDFRLFTTRDTTIWRYKQRMIRRTTRVLNHLQLLAGSGDRGGGGGAT